MIDRTRNEAPGPPAPIGPALLVAGLVAIAVGLLVPLAIGSFSQRQALVLALVEALFLAVVAIGIVVLARRLRASHDALWELARRDGLTGVGNYRALQERLAEEIARHERHQRQFSLIVLDLDGFKQVNERYGHLEGDRLLTEVGRSLREAVRGADAVFRQGGDEFAVIVEEADTEDAGEVAARIRDRLAHRSLGEVDGLPLTAATGHAVFPADGKTPEQLLNCADSDLLAAKRGEPRRA